jgi:hypothetical protein
MRQARVNQLRPSCFSPSIPAKSRPAREKASWRARAHGNQETVVCSRKYLILMKLHKQPMVFMPVSQRVSITQIV